MIKGDNHIKYGTSAHSNRTKNWEFLNCTQTYMCIALWNWTQTDHCASHIHCDCASEWPQGRELDDLACSWWRSAADSHLHHSPQGYSAPTYIIKSKFKEYIIIRQLDVTWYFHVLALVSNGTHLQYIWRSIRASLKSILVILNVKV
jgi:hypothetical protein